MIKRSQTSVSGGIKSSTYLLTTYIPPHILAASDKHILLKWFVSCKVPPSILGYDEFPKTRHSARVI